MRKLCIIFSLSLICVASSLAANQSTHTFNLNKITESVSFLSLHVRCKPQSPKYCSEPWAIVWNYTDSLNYRYATLNIPTSNQYNSNIYPSDWYIEVNEMANGQNRLIQRIDGSQGVNISGGENSMRLVADRVSARLYLGDTQQHFVATVPFRHENAGSAGVMHPQGIIPVRNTVSPITYPDPEYAHHIFDSTHSLAAYLADSKDLTEGLWQYLDCDINEKFAQPGGQYTLAVVKDPDSPSDYLIIYIAGAQNYGNSSPWQPLQIKGKLKYLPFVGHYNLHWRDANGTLLTRETSATLSTDAATITFNFPLLGSSMRFFRTDPMKLLQEHTCR